MSAVRLSLESIGSLELTDLSGICWPGPGQDTSDLFKRLLTLKLRRVTARLMEGAQKSAPANLAPGLSQLRESLEALTDPAWLTTFADPVACRPLDSSAQADGLGVEALPWCLSLGRFLVGAPEVEELRWMIPAEAIPKEGLYLPHLHALITSGCHQGPVAVQTDARTLTFTWTDGNRLTLPRQDLDQLRSQTLPRMRLLTRLGPFKLLNEVQEVRDQTARFWEQMRKGSVDADQLAQGFLPGETEARVFAEGAALLSQVWPEAAASCQRALGSAVILPHRGDGHYHSYTTIRFFGTLIATALNRVQVADVMAHEVAHTRMMPLFEFDPLIEDDEAPIHPSPWRKDPRPLKGLLNGVQAFLNVQRFYQRLPDLPDWPRARSEAIVGEQKEKLKAAWAYLADHAKPTPLGALLFEELSSAVSEL